MTAPLHRLLLAFATLALSCTRLTPERVELSGKSVEFVQAGDGGVTVVFEAGLGGDWTVWDPIASEVSASTRVFAYSRPGYGRSTPSTEERTATRIVEELRALLAARGLAPPWILVGHSFGGAYMELFAKAHPEEVAGLVLVDPRHRDFSAACEGAGFSGCSIPPSMIPSLPPEQRAELAGFTSVPLELEAAGTFGPYPVRVLSATAHGLPAGGEAMWQSMLGSLADEAIDGELVVFSGASHNLEAERPHQVAQIILQLVSMKRD